MKIINIFNRINKSPMEFNSEEPQYVLQQKQEYRFHCFFSGDGFFRIENDKFEINDYTFFLTFPRKNYSINYMPHSKPVIYYRIDFKLDESSSEFLSFINNFFSTQKYNSSNKKLISYIYDIENLYNIKKDFSLHSAASLLKSILYRLPNEYESKEVAPEMISYIDSACEFMKENLYKTINLNDICNSLNLTESYFIRIFKSYMNQPPMKYYNFLKTQEAAQLLIETKMTIAEISEALHFSSESHFNRTFKMHQSTTPGHYRKHYIYSLEARQKKSEQELTEAYTLLQKIIDASPDLIFYKDVNGILMGCNNAFAKIVGLPKEKIIGSSDFEIHPYHMAEFFLEHDRIVYKNNKPFKNEEWMSYPDGEKRRFEVYKAPFFDSDNNVIGLLGISRDITQRILAKQEMEKRKEEERIANEQKTQFLLTMTNEYLNSMTRIENQLLKNIQEINDKDSSFDKLFFECNYITILTKDIINFIEFQSGEMKFQIAAFNLLNFLNRIKTIVKKNHPTNSTINFRIHSEIPKIVFGDEARLLHVTILLINTVVMNALDSDIDITVKYSNFKAVFKIIVQGIIFSELKKESIVNAINTKENTFFKTGVDLSIAIANKIIKAMTGELDILFKEDNVIEYNLKLNLPSGIEYLNKYYSLKG